MSIVCLCYFVHNWLCLIGVYMIEFIFYVGKFSLLFMISDICMRRGGGVINVQLIVEYFIQQLDLVNFAFYINLGISGSCMQVTWAMFCILWQPVLVYIILFSQVVADYERCNKRAVYVCPCSNHRKQKIAIGAVQESLFRVVIDHSQHLFGTIEPMNTVGFLY